MGANLPPPTPPSSGSGWKASDILYVVGSVWGFLFTLIFSVTSISTGHPTLYVILPGITPIWFWVSSYAASKGD